MLVMSRLHLLEVQVGGAKIHYHAWRPPNCIVVAGQHSGEHIDILSGFERVQIIALLTKIYSFCAQAFIAFVISNPYSTPVIALDGYQGARKDKAGRFRPGTK